MAPFRCFYSGTTADFAIAQGAAAAILDALGSPPAGNPTGTAALLPLAGATFNVYKNDRTTLVTDLKDHTGATVSQVTSVASYDQRARFMWFEGPEIDPDTDPSEVPETLWLSPATGALAGLVFYALLPHAEGLVEYINGAVARAGIEELADVDDALLDAGNAGYTLVVGAGGGTVEATAAPGGGVTSHGALSGLDADDHPQYLTEGRGDALYSLLGHEHAQSEITGLVAALANVALLGHQHDASAIWTGILAIARMPSGMVFAVKESAPGSGIYTRSTPRTDMVGLFLGEEDPGPEALADDVFLRRQTP